MTQKTLSGSVFVKGSRTADCEIKKHLTSKEYLDHCSLLHVELDDCADVAL